MHYTVQARFKPDTAAEFHRLLTDGAVELHVQGVLPGISDDPGRHQRPRSVGQTAALVLSTTPAWAGVVAADPVDGDRPGALCHESSPPMSPVVVDSHQEGR